MESSVEFNVVKNTLTNLAQKLNIKNDLLTNDHNETEDSEDVIVSSEEMSGSITDRLRIVLKKSTDKYIPHKKVTSTRSSPMEVTIRREMEFFRTMGQRGKVLEILHSALMSVPPTSVEAERAFSVGGLFLTKIRSRLRDDTLSPSPR